MIFFHFFRFLDILDAYMWSHVAIPTILFVGIFLTFKFRGAQLVKFIQSIKTFYEHTRVKKGGKGVHPLSAFFASIGGCIGIGNLVAVCTAIQIGGPGAILWMWVAAFVGMILKYSEVYLGMRFRVPNGRGGYDGGPMYYLQRVIKGKTLPILFCILLAVYGTEIYMFDVMTHSVTENWGWNHYAVVAGILLLVMYTCAGGLNRVGKISSIILPIFLAIFGVMAVWILVLHASELPQVFSTIFKTAFTGHAPLGGFAGSGIMLAMSQGVARGCYSGDIGIGNAAIIHAESREEDVGKQSQLAVLGIFIDTFVVCTFTTLLIVATGVWNQGVPASLMVQRALELHFPYMNIFMPIFLLILGYSSLISFFFVGLKCAKYIHPKRGEKAYYIYAALSFVLFSFVDQSYALTVMSVVGAALLVINLIAIYRLRGEIEIEARPQRL